MKNCVNCGKDLPAPVNEFGDIDAPLCVSCFLNPPKTIDLPDENDKIAQLENDIRELEGEIEGLRDEIYDLEEQISGKRRKIREAKSADNDNKQSEIAAVKRKLKAWADGRPLVVKA